MTDTFNRIVRDLANKTSFNTNTILETDNPEIQYWQVDLTSFRSSTGAKQ